MKSFPSTNPPLVYGGLDIGTTGAKINVFSDNQFLLSIYESYPSRREKDAHTIKVEDILGVTIKLIKKALQNAPTLSALGITAFGEAFVLLDENDEPIFPTYLYTDQRGDEEVSELTRLISKQRVGEITGQYPHKMFSLAKLMYFKKHHPKQFIKANKFCLIADYIVYKLTGKRQVDYSSATRSQIFDITSLKWSNEILHKLEISEQLFPQPVPVGTSAGYILEEVINCSAKQIEIFSISHDQIAAAIGAHGLEEGVISDGLGTCECLTPLMRNVDDKQLFIDHGYGLIPFLEAKQYASYGLINTGGALVEWVINNYFSYELANRRQLYDYLNDFNLEFPQQAMVLPHFAGAATPYMDGDALGAIVNLSLGSTRFDIYQATLESLSYEAKIILDELLTKGIKVNKVYASGGGSNNDKWLQIKANVFNLPVTRLKHSDAGAVGSAMIIGYQKGIFSSLSEAADILNPPVKTFEPDPKLVSRYQNQFKKYQLLYEALKEVK